MDVCATSEVDPLISVLLNIFDTRQAVLALAQRLVFREIQSAGMDHRNTISLRLMLPYFLTASPTELFRENKLINMLLSAIVNQHGYRYLRTVLESLVKETVQMLDDTTFELDPAKIQPGDDLETNRRVVLKLAQSFIDCIIASAPRLPSSVLSPDFIPLFLADYVSFLFEVGSSSIFVTIYLLQCNKFFHWIQNLRR